MNPRPDSTPLTGYVNSRSIPVSPMDGIGETKWPRSVQPLGAVAQSWSTAMSIFDNSVETESRPTGMGSTGLPDDAHAEMQQAFRYGEPPTDEELDAMYAEWQARGSYDRGGQGHDDGPGPTS